MVSGTVSVSVAAAAVGMPPGQLRAARGSVGCSAHEHYYCKQVDQGPFMQDSMDMIKASISLDPGS